jgi:hypothetical protein
MKNHETPLEILFEKVEDCSTTTLELMKLKIIRTSADIASTFAIKIVFITFITLFIIIINIGIALWVSDLLGKSYHGFFVVAAFYGLMALLLRSYLNQWIKVPISNFIINQMLKQSTT